ncbi:sensor domain-containing phosphodiesterase [Oxalicibacterium faecigallinarum]|uniref:Sensor domain-containing phosphodiesterase n=2 Tax=Oxalicibacterium faecigallinarum TaxID=573741 RepID=A0A8J3AQL8_9BURK|nr:sensor domain-containing phosphodiesterase [Oxalicibacterium faecigallinarum]
MTALPLDRATSEYTDNSTLESQRLVALRRLGLLDSAPAEAFDRITRLAAQIFKLPIAAVSLTDSDRQWFKSRVGVTHQQIPRHLAPCSEVADTSNVLVIRDLLADDAFKHSHLATTGVRFYAGAPLITDDGFNLGAMCVLGHEPRDVTIEESKALSDLAALVMSQIELQHALGRIDAISGQPNRNQFREDFEDLEKDRPGQFADLVLLNIARAEEISSATRVMGSQYVEALVRGAASMLRAMLQPEGTIYHISDTQFVFFAPRDVDAAAYRSTLESFLSDYEYGVDSRYVTTATFGTTRFQIGLSDHGDVLRMAHSASQDAIQLEGRVKAYSPMEDAAYRRRFQLLHQFGIALENTERLHLVYQPRVNLATQKCVGAEALLRWTDPELGAVSPAEFMPIVECSAMIHATTAWVIENAVRQLATWRKEGKHWQIAVNISASNLLEPLFAQHLFAVLKRYGVDPSELELEVTESAIMTNPQDANLVLEQLVAHGLKIAIDDFGTGYSSLAYLQKLPAKILKIDRSFVKDLAIDERQKSLVLAMLRLAHELDYTVVAEGVESAEIMAVLQQMGCDEAQGYLFSPPLMPADFVAWQNSLG